MKQIAWATFNLLQFALACVWTAFWITAAVLVLLVTFRPRIPLTMARRIWAPGALFVARGRIQIERECEIAWDQPHVFVSNHQSMLDIPAVFLAVLAPLRFIGKKSLSYVPFVGWYMRATGMVFVDRGSSTAMRESVKAAGRRIRERSSSIIAFPEGTRSRTGRIARFKKGPFVLAIESGVPIVPMAIEGSRHVMRPGAISGRPGRIRVRLGRPIETSEFTPEDRGRLAQLVRDRILELHEAIGGPGSVPAPDGGATSTLQEREASG